MSYNVLMGELPPPVSPPMALAPRPRPVGGKVARGRRTVKMPDGRVVPARAPGTNLYVPGFLDDEADAALMREGGEEYEADALMAMQQGQLGIAIPLAPVIGIASGLFGKKVSEKEKWLRSTRADGHAAGAGSVSAVAQLLSAAKDSKYPERRRIGLEYLTQLANGQGYDGKKYVQATPAVQLAAQKALATLGQSVGPVATMPTPTATGGGSPSYPVTVMPGPDAPQYDPSTLPTPEQVAQAAAGAPAGGGFDLKKWLPVILVGGLVLLGPKRRGNPRRRRRR